MDRPLSTSMFLVGYRFHITSALPILQRLTGISLTVGSILLGWDAGYGFQLRQATQS